MPKRKTQEEPEQIQSSSASEAEQTTGAPKAKQTAKKPAEYAPSQPSKTIKKPKFISEEHLDTVPSSSNAPQTEVKILKNTEDEKYLDLGKKKRATVRTFKGKVFLDIREFFGPDNDEKPGKKGISLSQEQWNVLKNGVSVIDSFFTEQQK
ncbi:hypothetical protein ID866_3053 [Astraeus odoratus]|nr:hypothetical protein ID866_3053 [Astraeus odoratus]